MSLSVDPKSVQNVLVQFEKFDEKVRAGLLAITKIVAKKMEAWARDNAPWTDQTGDARRKLQGDAKWEKYTILVVTMSHRVPYGVWLELAHERKYAILEKAIDKYKDDFVKEWKEIAKGVKV